MRDKQSFSQLARWSVRFTLLQCAFFYLICFKYATSLFPLDLPDFLQTQYQFTVVIFIIATYIGQFALLATLWILLPCLLFAALSRRPWVVLTVGWLTAYCAIIFFLLDGQLYSLYRVHLNSTYLQMAFGGHANDLFNLSTLEWNILILGTLAIGFLQAVLVRLVWRWNSHPLSTWPWLLCLLAMMQISYAMYFNSMHQKRNEYSVQTKAFPFYRLIVTAWFPKKWGADKLQHWGEVTFTQAKKVDRPVNYPLHSMQCASAKRLNVLFIVVDTWRPDSITPQIMPYTHSLRSQTLDFQDHISGGNGTQPGMFSLFYSIPSTYFAAMLAHKEPPVIMEQAKAAGYQIGEFVSASAKMPDFQDTIYLHTDKLFDGATISNNQILPRDLGVTAETKKWLKQQQNKPFISLAFFDVAHAYCETPLFNTPFKDGIRSCNRLQLNRHTDPIPYLHRYDNAVHFVDSQIHELLQSLKQQGLDKNTVVILTGDHGQEFNDNKRNYWEHANDFSQYQVKVPLLILWPGKAPQKVAYRTDHYDIVPTLLQEIFSCNNPIADYSIGKNLFDSAKRDAILVGSYLNNAIVERNKITLLWSDGEIEMQAGDTRDLPQEKPDIKLVSRALIDMRRFYRP